MASNLAMSFAHMGQKTLILDAKLRRGIEHHLFGSRQSPGLSNSLVEKHDVYDACRPTTMENLQILPCGDNLEGDIEALGSPQFVEVIDKLRKRYQRIIVDSTPVLGLAETCVIQPAMDGVVLVIWSGQTPTRAVRTAIDILNDNDANFYGFVLNRLDLMATMNRFHSYYTNHYDNRYQSVTKAKGQECEQARQSPVSASPYPAASAKPPGVSVVIPAHHYTRFLPFAVESCLRQDYPNFEVVVIDDGSKDNTREVMARYGPPVRYVHQQNAGLSAARNTGIREAKFDYVCFLDADDLLLPTHLSDSMAAFAKLPPDFALVACDDVLVDVDGKPQPFTVHVPVLPREVTLKDILMRTRFSPTGAVARKEVFALCGGFDTTLRSTEDRDMWIRIAAQRRIWHQGKVLVEIRKHGNNMSNNADRIKSNMSAVLKKAYDAGIVRRSNITFWLQVWSYWRSQSSLIDNGIRQPARAYRELIRSVLLWTWFLDPAANGNPPFFRLRAFVRYTLNVVRGEVKP